MTSSLSIKKAVFLDRDGVLVSSVPNDYIRSIDQIRILSKVKESLAILDQMNYILIIITNQGAVSKKIITFEQANNIQDKIIEIIRPSKKIPLYSYICPHQESDACSCRKPKPGMLLQAAKEHSIDLSRSYLIGDAASDIEAACTVGVRPILVMTGRGIDDRQKAKELCKGLIVVESLKDAVGIIK